MQSDRLMQIRHHLYRFGQTGVTELAKIVDSSVATIRRDLQRLEEQGLVRRTHGGAEIIGTGSAEIDFQAREHHGLATKRAIADAAYAQLCEHSSVFLDSGTTVLQLAKRLRLEPIPLVVFTNSVAIVSTLLDTPRLQLNLLPGRVRNENRSIVGPLAERCIETLWFDQLFLGASAVQPDGSISTPDSEEASLNAAMTKRATLRFLLIDSQKFGRHSTFRVGTLDNITHVITDSHLSEEWVARLQQAELPCTRADVPTADEGQDG